ncbi:MAG: TIGR04211 family SH3 domain-containing protein [Deltaproteobacteria bacterium]|nr:TIGR04211 family SH3 domain-containing protein [Deltaproteobacteria bacterium]MBW2122440.1 TIGR04211 family SH3 domain-containing protein [Deltaproteobacteria bacterium]
MTKRRWYLSLLVFSLFWWPGIGSAETMYVTDRLYLSLRSIPDQDQPAIALLPSDTKVEVLEIQNNWARVALDDGRTGWVLKRFLVKDVPKSVVIEQLKQEIEKKDFLLDKLQSENASRQQEISDRAMLEAKQKALQKKIEALKSQISQQKKRIEVSTKEDTVKRLKEVYVTGIVALFLGLVTGYMLRKPKKKRQIFF